MNTHPIRDSRLLRAARRTFAPLQKSRGNHRSNVCLNRSPVLYVFRAGAKAIQYNVTLDELIEHSSKSSSPIRVMGSVLIVVCF